MKIKLLCGVLALAGLILLPSIVLAQGGPDPNSPRGRAIVNLNKLLQAEEDDLEKVIDELIAPSLKEEKGNDLLRFVQEIRAQLSGFNSESFRPIGPTTVGTTHNTEAGEVDVQFSVEAEAPHRLISL